jgi:hypothetical protein
LFGLVAIAAVGHQHGRKQMSFRSLFAWTTAASVVIGAPVTAQAFDETKYPAFEGQWIRTGAIERYDQTKPPGRGQEPPLTPEYRAIFEANLADVAKGGFGDDPVYSCILEGMPRAMNLILPMEIVIKANTTYLMMEYLGMLRRVFTDGRSFPENQDPSWMGYSVGRWIDEDGDGRYDVLEIETRNMKNPRTFDASGVPLHKDAQTIVKERIYLDKADPDILHDEITTYDHALTRPWSVKKSMHRERNPVFIEAVCAEDNLQVNIGNEHYMLNGARELMPAKKDQAPPDLKHFSQQKK